MAGFSVILNPSIPPGTFEPVDPPCAFESDLAHLGNTSEPHLCGKQRLLGGLSPLCP